MTAGKPPSERSDRPARPATTDDEGWGKAADEVRSQDGTVSDEDAWLAARNTARMNALDSEDATAKPAVEPAPEPEPEPAAEPAAEPASKSEPEPASKSEPEPTAAADSAPASGPSATKEPTPPRAEHGNDGGNDGGRGGPKKKRRRWRGVLWTALFGLMAAGIAALVILGMRNSRSYYLHCDAEHIVAQRGRAFPPWGRSLLSSPQWAPIPVPDECEDQVFATEEALGHELRQALVAQAEAWITTERPEGNAHERIDEVQAQLEQALMLSRSPQSRDVRAHIERLLGDLDYWRGQDEIAAARARLEAALARFQEAHERNPRHAGDVAAWKQFIEQMQRELGQGPPGSRPLTGTPDVLAPELESSEAPPPSTGGQPDIPASSGDAPNAGAPPRDAGAPPDAGPGTDARAGTAQPPKSMDQAPAAPPPDAGVSRRGNLI